MKIVDFGIAKLRESGAHTQTGMVLGTPAYMSFEQASGMRSDELDARSDIYSLGVVVYEMLTGRTPFHSDTPVGYLRMHMQEDPPSFRTVKSNFAALPQFEIAVMKALTKDRNQRYGSVLEFAREFAQATEAGTQLAAHPEAQREAAKSQPQTAVTPAPSTIVPTAVGDTVAAKAVPETAHPSRRKWLWSRWKKIGVIASIIWILGAGIYTLKVTNDADMRFAFVMWQACLEKQVGENECEQLKQAILDGRLPSERMEAAIVAFVPVSLAWGFIYLVLFLVRWFRRPPEAAQPLQFQTISRPHKKVKFFIIAGAALIVIVVGVWYFSHHSQRPDFTNSNETTLADAYYVTAFRNGAYIIEHKGHRMTAKCRESLTFFDGPYKPGRPMTDHDCTYMVDRVGKSIGDDLMRQEQNQLVFSPWRGINTVQTADFLDITNDELIRTGSGLSPAQEQVKSPPAAIASAAQKPRVEAPLAELGPNEKPPVPAKLSETLQWLKGASEEESGNGTTNITFESNGGDSCAVTITETRAKASPGFWIRESFSLTDIDPEDIQVENLGTGASKEAVAGQYSVRFHTTNYAKKIIHTSSQLNEPIPTSDYTVFTNELFAPKFKKAFKKAVELCGGKRSSF